MGGDYSHASASGGGGGCISGFGVFMLILVFAVLAACGAFLYARPEKAAALMGEKAAASDEQAREAKEAAHRRESLSSPVDCPVLRCASWLSCPSCLVLFRLILSGLV